MENTYKQGLYENASSLSYRIQLTHVGCKIIHNLY